MIKLEDEYFVLYKRDMKSEKSREYNERMLFDKCRFFKNLEQARRFALRNLPTILAKRDSLNQKEISNLRDKEKPYVVVAKHYGKYRHYDYLGDSDPLETYDAVRSSENEIEKTIESLAKEEHVEEIIAGLELKIIGGE